MTNKTRFLVKLSPRAVTMLDELAAHGIYGADAHEVAARMIDESLQRFVGRPVLSVVPHVDWRARCLAAEALVRVFLRPSAFAEDQDRREGHARAAWLAAGGRMEGDGDG